MDSLLAPNADKSADERVKSMPKIHSPATTAVPTPNNNGISKWKFSIGLSATMLGSALPAGHNLGVINTPQQEIRQWLKRTFLNQYGVNLSLSQYNLLWGLVVSIFIVGACIGSSAGAILAQKYGRKKSFFIIHSLCMASGFMIMSCQYVGKLELLFFGRLTAGLSAGASMSLTPLYLSEISAPSLNGVMGTLFPLGLTSGMLIAQIFGLPSLLGRLETWALLVGGHAVYAFLSLLFQPWLPEVENHLTTINTDLVTEQKDKLPLDDPGAAEEASLFIYDVECERKCTEKSFMEVMKDPTLRKPVLCISLLNAGQQLAGINAVFFYSTMVYMEAGLGKFQSQAAALGAGVANVLMAASAVSLIRRYRRKKLLNVSISLYMVCQCLQLFSLYFFKDHHWMIWMAFASLFLTVLTYGIGLGPVPYMLGTEIFPEESRSVGLAIGSMSNWAANLFVGISFPLLQENMGILSTLIFIIFCSFLLVFVNAYVPETYEKKFVPQSNLEQNER